MKIQYQTGGLFIEFPKNNTPLIGYWHPNLDAYPGYKAIIDRHWFLTLRGYPVSNVKPGVQDQVFVTHAQAHIFLLEREQKIPIGTFFFFFFFARSEIGKLELWKKTSWKREVSSLSKQVVFFFFFENLTSKHNL